MELAYSPHSRPVDLYYDGEYRGGYLLEMDCEDRAKEEASWFSTSLGMYLAVKSPEYLPGEAMD